MSKFLDVADIVTSGVCDSGGIVKQGDYFIEDNGHVHIATQHYSDKRWVLIDLETGQPRGGNTTISEPTLADITSLHMYFKKINI